MTELQRTESYTVYLGVLFLSKLSHNPDFFQIALILVDEACMKCRQNIEEYIPVLVIGSDGPPKPKKN